MVESKTVTQFKFDNVVRSSLYLVLADADHYYLLCFEIYLILEWVLRAAKAINIIFDCLILWQICHNCVMPVIYQPTLVYGRQNKPNETSTSQITKIFYETLLHDWVPLLQFTKTTSLSLCPVMPEPIENQLRFKSVPTLLLKKNSLSSDHG